MIDKKINSKENITKNDIRLSIALMAPFIILTIQYFLLTYFNIINTSGASIIQLISKGLVGITFLYALPIAIKRNKIQIIVIYFVSIFIFVINFLIFPSNRAYLNEMIFPFFFMCLPSFIYALNVRNFLQLKEVMNKTSYIVLIIGAILSISVYRGSSSIGAYSMSLSYYMLLPSIMFLDELISRFSFKTLAKVLLSLIITLSLGARGPILCIGVFIILKYLRLNNKSTTKRVMSKLNFLGIAIVFLAFFNEIILHLYNLLIKLGINSRTLLLFTQSKVHLSGRDKIYENVLKEIIKKPIVGIGVMGDRTILNGSYVHNFLIEVISNFGIIIGAIILLIVFILIVKSLITKSELEYNLSIIWLSLGFVHLMVSSSYLIDIKFWIFMGVLINLSKGDKRIDEST